MSDTPNSQPDTAPSTHDLRQNLRTFLRLPSSFFRPQVDIGSEAREDGYIRKLLRYSARDGDTIEAFLFQPANEQSRGAVLALHQHNSQWAIGKSEIAGLIGDPLQAFGPALAQRGITVLAPDSIGFESRMKEPGGGAALAPAISKPHSSTEGWLQYYNQMAHRLVRGELLMTKILDDSATGLSVLQDLSGADRPGVLGHSMGGTAALFLGALDARAAFVCSSGALGSYRHKLANGIGLEMSLVIPGLAQHYDLDDLLRCVAPRSVFVVSSDEDPMSGDAEDLVVRALPAFEALGCPGHLQHLRVAGPHALDRARHDAILDWTTARALGASPPPAARTGCSAPDL